RGAVRVPRPGRPGDHPRAAQHLQPPPADQRQAAASARRTARPPGRDERGGPDPSRHPAGDLRDRSAARRTACRRPFGGGRARLPRLGGRRPLSRSLYAGAGRRSRVTRALGRAAASGLLGALAAIVWLALFYGLRPSLTVDLGGSPPRLVSGIYPGERDPVSG